VIAIAAALIVACSAPVPNATPAAAEPPVLVTTVTPSASPAAAEQPAPIAQPQATVAASPLPSPAAPTSAPTPAPGPVSAGIVPEAGVLFFPDYDGPSRGAPDYGRAFPEAMYRYDGASGSIAKLERPFVEFVVHETAGGVYLQGQQGRMDLLRWDGTFASDREFTACQVQSAPFASFFSFCAVSATGVGVGSGSHTGPGPGPFTRPFCPPAFIRLPGEAQARPLLLPSGSCVSSAQVSADGTQLLIRGIAPDPSPGVAPARGRCEPGYYTLEGDYTLDGITRCYRLELWVMPVGGSPRQLRLSPDLPGAGLALSPDGRSATAEHLGGLFLVDVSTGRTTFLGSVYGVGSPRWSASGRLAFVRGGGQESWFDKTVVVVEPDGSMRELRGYKSDGGTLWPSGLAPAWDSTGKRLAWIASPAYSVPGKEGDAQDYLDGRGVGDRRVLVSDLASDPLEVRCGEGVAEGVRWSNDGTALLILCRRPGARVNAFELWLHRLGAPGRAAVPVVRGLTWGGVSGYGLSPSLFTHTAWSRALAIAPR